MNQPTLIEATAKKYKAAQAVGTGLIVLAVVALLFGAGAWIIALFFVPGLVVYIYGRSAAWWHHR